MALKINKDIKLSYSHTLKEIMEVDQQELWLQATECVKKMSEVQRCIVELLPECRKQLPESFKELNDVKAQSNLANHIRLRSLFALCEKIWEIIEDKCKALAECSGRDVSKERDVQESLLVTLTAVAEFPFDSIIEDINKGLHRINEQKDKFKENLDFMVYENWSFRDIIGTIDIIGITHQELWKSVLNSRDPEASNLKNLLDDNTMVRVY